MPFSEQGKKYYERHEINRPLIFKDKDNTIHVVAKQRKYSPIYSCYFVQLVFCYRKQFIGEKARNGGCNRYNCV